MSERETETALQPPERGSGPLLERDYWAVLEARDPTRIADVVARHFEAFPPPSLVRFRRAEGAAPSGEPLEVGDELIVDIIGAGEFGVRVVHRDRLSLTLATLAGHPEAGRITFGAYPNDRGDVVFHIRSRARAASASRWAGFIFAGDPMQTNTWSDFIQRLAATESDGIFGAVHAEKQEVVDEPGDREADRPTFIAVADGDRSSRHVEGPDARGRRGAPAREDR